MRKYLTLLLLLATISVQLFALNAPFSTAGFYPVEGSNREVLNFNPGWRFYKGAVADAYLTDFDDSQWEAANLPHGLEILGENASGCRNYQGEAWYRKEFAVERSADSGRVFIYFEAAMGKSKVWVNGTLVAEQYGGYLPFAADITDVVHYDGDVNVIAVMVDNSNDPTYLPGTKQEGLDFAYLGGIYRDVYMIYTSSVHVTLPEVSKKVAGGGVFVATLSAKERRAELAIKTEVTNTTAKRERVVVKSVLEDSSYTKIGSVESSFYLSKGKAHTIEQKLKATDVALWHPDQPNLNYIKTEVWIGDKRVDCMRTRIGIRYVEMLGEKGMYINGEPFDKKLIGANRHQDYVYVGNALPNSGQWRDVKLLKEGGCNVIRVAHYPMDDAFYDACDELGVVTTSATPGWHFFNNKVPLFEKRLYDDTRRLIRKDRNRPSIFMWETALNETPEQPEHVLKRMHEVAHEEYPYYGLFTVTDMHEALKGGMDLHYHGTDPAVNSFTRECGDGGEVDNWYSHNAITRIKMEWGERALTQQAERLAVVLGELNATPKTRLGGALWAGIEHQRGYHPDPFWGGLLDLYRMPKYSYYLYGSQTATEPLVHIAHELTQTSDADIIIYSNCDEVRLTYNGKLIGTQQPSTRANYGKLPHAPFVFEDAFHLLDVKTPGRNNAFVAEMVAEGLIDGEVVATQTKLYPLRSEALMLEISDEGLELLADGSDFVPVRAIVVDINGTKKVVASEEIYFQVEGEGSLIGGAANNANPTKSIMGVATALVRATTTAGKIRITAHSAGLKSATIELNSVASPLTLMFDKVYTNNSVQPDYGNAVLQLHAPQQEQSESVEQLLQRINDLEMQLVGKEQEVMELRSTSNK